METHASNRAAVIPRRPFSAGPLHRLTQAVEELVFPPRCVCCSADLPAGGPEPHLCRACCSELADPSPRRCGRCGKAWSKRAEGRNVETELGCPSCQKRKLLFDRAVCLGPYEGELRRAVLSMKKRGSTALSLAMGRLLAEKTIADLDDEPPDLVVPIPMYWSRRIARGVNSAELLAEATARQWGVPMVRGMLRRSRNTLPQFELPPRMRFRNVRDAFRLRVGYALRAARVLLIDDILTTGATASEAARALKAGGAAHVTIAALARTEVPPR